MTNITLGLFAEFVVILFVGFLIGYSIGEKRTDIKWIHNSKETIPLRANGKNYMVYKQK